jgi:hypothetical protein
MHYLVAEFPMHQPANHLLEVAESYQIKRWILSVR